ncbi:flagellar biosynthesis anti-sigma factor FlgM [Uliginosibacterium gangwonense]|uniref:flagellar biosynthesis anti-sigma factor FlgM n=1 Tax=Uliginosibacterium gangwonense TaxID=392736 RepID=UPI0004776413|nr:flagellar biosynthesis anti-sigma factor FlgM [Uliginosibacterium gangwonense]
MKIDNSVKTTNTVTGESKTRSTRPSTSTSSTPSDTKVEISSLSGRMQQLEQAVADTPVVDSGRVDEIKQAISQGQFQVNSEKVADGLISSVRQMLAAQPRSV